MRGLKEEKILVLLVLTNSTLKKTKTIFKKIKFPSSSDFRISVSLLSVHRLEREIVVLSSLFIKQIQTEIKAKQNKTKQTLFSSTSLLTRCNQLHHY
jgi:hypothetical protein